ncbi:MAG TPA: molybdopterin-guanine dinucleotide biosynthesis protein B [Candidatus Krumholzibacteria bacterium]|nr:molybdopterin-guanine dinucleotide biosynthesis protein B [Candidatus Krumholzibacteria bacterium]
MNARPQAVAFVAPSGTGKTTLVEAVIRTLRGRGWRVGALKHDAHDFDIDHPGKDSHRFREAGAGTTAIASATQVAVMRTTASAWSLDRVLATCFGDEDLVLVEGYSTGDLPKIAVHRAATGQPLRVGIDDPDLIAVVTDVELETGVRCFALDRPAEVAAFLETTLIRRRPLTRVPQ